MIAEGGPTDSETLTNLFHFYGVNMRYLGEVLKTFREISASKGVSFKHIEFLLEKEILVRSLKHKIIEYLT